MFNGGLVTIYVADMDRSVRFYTDQLGLPLMQRYGDHFATVDGGRGLVLGLHPSTEVHPAGGSGGISIGFYLTGKLSDAVSTLKARGIEFEGPVVSEGKAGSFAHFSDPDGHPLYIAEMRGEYKDDKAGVR